MKGWNVEAERRDLGLGFGWLVLSVEVAEFGDCGGDARMASSWLSDQNISTSKFLFQSNQASAKHRIKVPSSSSSLRAMLPPNTSAPNS